MECPKCWQTDSVTIEFTPEFNKRRPYEAVCYNCGWFSKRYKTKEELNAEFREMEELQAEQWQVTHTDDY